MVEPAVEAVRVVVPVRVVPEGGAVSDIALPLEQVATEFEGTLRPASDAKAKAPMNSEAAAWWALRFISSLSILKM